MPAFTKKSSVKVIDEYYINNLLQIEYDFSML